MSFFKKFEIDLSCKNAALFLKRASRHLNGAVQKLIATLNFLFLLSRCVPLQIEHSFEFTVNSCKTKSVATR